MNAAELRGVTKAFGAQVAVDDLTLDVPRGSIYGFIGPNGSGKTTTLRMIMNILLPDAGSIRLLDGSAPGGCTERMGYLPEERGLYRRMKVRDQLQFIAQLKRGRRMAREIDAWLDRLGLAAWADRKIEALSKGMSQKVQFIAAVASEPELLILDEPFSGLDPVNVDLLRAAVIDLRRAGVTVIFSTHDMSVAETLCDFILMIFRGRKVLDGTLHAIQDRYGADVLKVQIEGDGSLLADLPGVERVVDRGQCQELRLAPSADSQAVLAALAGRGRVRHFEVTRPSLHDIFVRIAGPEAASKPPRDEPVPGLAPPAAPGPENRSSLS
ncbi:MAG TPA: ATP-binding cassette domain-containing protein [Candidatus Paceibacterota bacterium]|nr:ATP-binding cassette domain-containing protein [Verrucomicrobiota bacterium]HOX03145.1 ATP-binding cassette domain-containing protein [Verrucomicrobiota bacterium]HRZ45871.1 ATP-binding cassette domain-containing protein [Candidatus Paceibacterota bacterium]